MSCKLFFKRTASVVVVTYITLLGQISIAHAGMVGTSQVVQTETAASARHKLEQLLAREDVARGLASQGVDPAQAHARVAALTDQEVLALAQDIKELPAGGFFEEEEEDDDEIAGMPIFLFIIGLFGLLALLIHAAKGSTASSSSTAAKP